MRTLKPSCLSVLTRCVEQRGAHYLAVCVLAHVPLRESARLCSEQSLWTSLAKVAPGYVEACMPKVRSEFLLYGTAYQGIGSSASRSEFGVRFAGLVKAGQARGLRLSDGRQVLRELPFEPVPIQAGEAYGGADYPANIFGTGHPSSRRDDGLVLLPRIELISHPWHESPGRNMPALFGSVDITHPTRAGYAGTYNDSWLKEHAPGLPPDANWLLFNTALPDQQRDEPFQGDEAYDLLNLMPDTPHVNGRLPGIAARVLLRRKSALTVLEDVATSLRTVVFLPDADRVLLTWQGLCRIQTDDASDVDLLVLGAEHLGRRKPVEHYAAVIRARLDDEDGLYASLREADLLPPDMPFEGLLPPDTDLNRYVAQDRLQARLRRRTERQMHSTRERVAQEKLDPDEHAPPARLEPLPVFPPLHEMGAWSRKIEAQGQEKLLQARQLNDRHLAQAEQKYTATGRDFAAIRREMSGADQPGPPPPVAAPTIAKLRELDAMALSQPAESDEVKQMLADDALQKSWHDTDAKLAKAYQEGAHARPRPPRSEGEKAAAQRRWVESCLARRAPLKGQDLTGADLRGLDLSGMDLSEAQLAGADLRGVRLVGARLHRAVLAYADLSEAVADEADFTETNLGRARCEKLQAARALFKETLLFEAHLTMARLQAARFVQAQFYRALLTGLDLRGADLAQAQFLQANLSGSDLTDARIEEAQFIGGNLKHVCFRQAQGAAVVFLSVVCPQADFSGARLPGSRWVGRIDLSGARFEGGVLTDAYFGQGSVLREVTMDELDGAGIDWTACDLEGAKVRRALLREGSLRRANARMANFTGSNLMGAVLSHAHLEGAQLVACNLYGTEMSRIRVDTRTQFTASLTDRAKLFPRWKPDAEVAA